jgi:hypothetical protein
VEDFVKGTFKVDRLKEWEEKYHYQYFHYPNI